MSYAIIGVVTLLFIVFVVLSAKTWHWVNIVFLVLVFLVGLAASLTMSHVTRLRSNEILQLQRNEKLADELQRQADEAVFGPWDSLDYGEDSLRRWTEDLQTEMAGRGRVWNSGQVEVQENNRLFKFAGVATDAVAANPNSMQDLLLQVFADVTIGDQTLPIKYIGAFRVIAQTNESAALEPVFVMDAKEYAEPSTTWTLFEKMPADRRDAFRRMAGIPEDAFDLEKSPAEIQKTITEYREKLVNEYLPAQSTFGFDLNDPAQAARYEAIIDRYAFDGVSLGQIENWIESQASNRANTRFDPLPEEVFVVYIFNKKSNRSYQVDAAGNLNLNTDGLFTPLGHMVDPSLHAGTDIQFEKDDVVWIDQLTADGYQRGANEQVPPFRQLEDVTETARVFVRQVRDFPFLLGDLTQQTKELAEEVARTQENNAKTQNADQDSLAQIALRDDHITKLREDRDRLAKDLEQIRNRASELKLQQEESKQRIKQIQVAIQDLHSQIMGNAISIPSDSTTPAK